MLAKICDTAFEHAWYMNGTNCGYRKADYPEDPGVSAHGIKWYRGEDYHPTCFFLDRSLPLVDTVEAERKIAILGEPPAIRPECYDYAIKNHRKFNYILTCSEAFIKAAPERCLRFPLAGCASWLPVSDRQLYPKSKLVSTIVSWKKQQTYGQRLRHIASAICVGRVDTFDGDGRLPSKLPTLQDYMFSVVIENCQHDDYYTEKLLDAFATGTVPIYWGSRGVSKYFDARGIIYFDRVEQLSEIIDVLTPELYESMRPAVVANYYAATACAIPEDWLYTQYPFLFDGSSVKDHVGELSKTEILSLVGAGATILEIGAHEGSDTASFLTEARAKHVVAFEPDARPAQRFRQRLAPQLAAGGAITFFRCAVGAYTGEVRWFSSHGAANGCADWDSSSSIHPPTAHLQSHPSITFVSNTTVPCVRLDDVANLPTFDFAWIDVQGAQREVIAGGRRVLDATKWLYIECHPVPMYAGETTLSELCALLPAHEAVGKYDWNILFKRKAQ
jgi:FkbM family methyltransferase